MTKRDKAGGGRARARKDRIRTIVSLSAAATFALYYAAVKIAEPGKWLDFAAAWPALALVSLALAFPGKGPLAPIGRFLSASRAARLALAVPLGGFVAGSIAILAMIAAPVAVTAGDAGNPTANPGGTRYLLVLGGGLRADGQPTAPLRARLDAAVGLMRRESGLVAIVTGGKLPGTPRAEGDAMGEYLESRGIGRERILRETAARDTIQNMANSLAIIRSRGEVNPEILLLTSGFHLRRSLLLARAAGLPVSACVPVPCPPLFAPNAYLREIGAWWKLGIRRAFFPSVGDPAPAR